MIKMADYKYSYNGKTQNVSKAVLRDAPISTKVAIEMCSYLRGRSAASAKHLLALVLEKKHAIPFKRFTDGVGHKKGALSSGRYPQKASEHFLRLIKSAEANAADKSLSEDLVIGHLAAHKASTPWHFGRLRRRQMKRTHVEIVLHESAVKKDAKKVSGKATKQDAKPKAAAKKAASSAKPASKETSAPKKDVKPKTAGKEAKAAPAKTQAKDTTSTTSQSKTTAKPASVAKTSSEDAL